MPNYLDKIIFNISKINIIRIIQSPDLRSGLLGF
jgi:hypothetical protein